MKVNLDINGVKINIEGAADDVIRVAVALNEVADRCKKIVESFNAKSINRAVERDGSRLSSSR